MSEQGEADHAAVLDELRRFVREVLAPRAAWHDATAASVSAHLPALAAMGVMGANLPERYGGLSVSGPLLYRIVEEVAAGCAATASMVTAHFLASDAVLLAGDPEQQARWLPRLAAGTALGAFALTEPGAGSNPAEIATRAVRTDGGGYRLTGTKHFITNGGEADLLVVFARTDATAPAGARGISAFLAERPAPGLVTGPPEATMGLRGSHVVELAFDSDLSASCRLGAEGDGFRLAMRVLDAGRIEVAAMCTGIARAALAAALAWARERRVGGEVLARKQAVQQLLAEMALRHAAARRLGLAAAARRHDPAGVALDSALAKLAASEAAFFVCDTALQLHGGYGYTARQGIERLVRDVRVMRIYEGASEIQRTIIARALLADEGALDRLGEP